MLAENNKTTSDGKRSMLSEKLLGVYVETDFESKRITIGKGIRKIILNTIQAKVLSKTLNHQINADYLFMEKAANETSQRSAV